MHHDRATRLLALAVVLAGCAAPIPGGSERIGGDPHPGTPVATQQTPETPVPTAEPRSNLSNASTEHVVRHEFSHLLGAERVEQRPPPIRNADVGERRSEW